jgi:hypothetical protein
MHGQSSGRQLWRWYQGVLSVLVWSMMVCLSVLMPPGAVWLIGWPSHGDGSPGVAILVGLLLAVLLWPMAIWMVFQVPRTWRLMAWPLSAIRHGSGSMGSCDQYLRGPS